MKKMRYKPGTGIYIYLYMCIHTHTCMYICIDTCVCMCIGLGSNCQGRLFPVKIVLKTDRSGVGLGLDQVDGCKEVLEACKLTFHIYMCVCVYTYTYIHLMQNTHFMHRSEADNFKCDKRRPEAEE